MQLIFRVVHGVYFSGTTAIKRNMNYVGCKSFWQQQKLPKFGFPARTAALFLPLCLPSLIVQWSARVDELIFVRQTNESHREIDHVKIVHRGKFQSCRTNTCEMTGTETENKRRMYCSQARVDYAELKIILLAKTVILNIHIKKSITMGLYLYYNPTNRVQTCLGTIKLTLEVTGQIFLIIQVHPILFGSSICDANNKTDVLSEVNYIE